jgi:hypothetical protein
MLLRGSVEGSIKQQGTLTCIPLGWENLWEP